MINIENNLKFEDELVVLDEDDNTVIGLVQNDFTVLLYDPDENEVSSIISVTITEIGNGVYKTIFTPNKLGNWELIVSNSTYFPWGKYGHYKSVKATANKLFDYLEKTLGLCQSNYRIFDPISDRSNQLLSGKIRTYHSAADVDSDTNPIAEYEISATYGIGKYRNIVTGYKVKEVE